MPAIGDTFLRYKISALIGSGGMGEVYLARDLQLARNVAVKILKPKLSHRHGDALERFVLEARSASALNHPNIITIYEIGEAEGSHYIASEYIDGKTLHERVSRKSLTMPEILNIAIQTAEALTAAHAAGIVHRDIKPDNIMIRDDGYVKVLDFGLAKLTEQEMQLSDIEADTRRMVATNPGVVMGTVSYMSPEQARGKGVDKRTDIWSLGVVLYEMVTGQRPFTGETTSDVIAAILKSDPEPVSMFFADVPHELERIIGKALRKDRDERYQHIKDLLIDLKDLRRELEVQMHSDTASLAVTKGERSVQPTGDGNVTAESTAGAGLQTSSISEMFITQFRLHPILLTAIIVVSVLAVAAAAWVGFRTIAARGPAAFESMRFAKLTSIGNVEGGQIAVSPDGKYFAYVAREPAGRSLWVRQTAASSGVQLATPAQTKFNGLTFSRDGSFIYYCATEQGGTPTVFKTPVLGGERRRIVADADGPVTLSPHGDRLAFVRNESKLVVAYEDGNDQSVLATAEDGSAWLLPAWSPDGRKIVSGVYKRSDNLVHIMEVDVQTGKVSEFSGLTWLRVSGLAWLPDASGILISGRDVGTQLSQVWLIAYPGGYASRITNDLSSYQGLGVTSDGRSVVTVQETRLANIWTASDADFAGLKRITSETGRDEGLSGLAWTPDGDIVYTTRTLALQDLWAVGSNGSSNRQLTFDARSNFSPAVSPDGRFIVFISTRTGSPEIWRIDRDGSNPVQLTSEPGIEIQPVISADGKWIIYELNEGNERSTIWKLPMDGGQPVRLTDINSGRPVLSPDGKFVAFRFQLPSEPPRIGMMSVEGGDMKDLGLTNVAQAGFYRWSSDGSALLYIDRNDGASRLLSQPLKGGPAAQLAEMADRQIFSFDVSKTGRGIALSLGSETSEAVLVNNFKQ
jgi:serine/threonine protein kinase/Tol biopolymer transport system component